MALAVLVSAMAPEAAAQVLDQAKPQMQEERGEMGFS